MHCGGVLQLKINWIHLLSVSALACFLCISLVRVNVPFTAKRKGAALVAHMSSALVWPPPPSLNTFFHPQDWTFSAWIWEWWIKRWWLFGLQSYVSGSGSAFSTCWGVREPKEGQQICVLRQWSHPKVFIETQLN